MVSKVRSNNFFLVFFINIFQMLAMLWFISVVVFFISLQCREIVYVGMWAPRSLSNGAVQRFNVQSGCTLGSAFL